jgi:regulator of sigma E protease
MILLIVVLVFGGMVFLHELGHFLAARLFNIEVEEFGFGFPPRMLRFWRAKGKLTIAGREIQIPDNFDLPFDSRIGTNKAVKATVDSLNGKLVLRTIELVKEPGSETPASQTSATQNEFGILAQMGRKDSGQASISVVPTKRGETEIAGVLTYLEVGTEFTINWLPLGGFVRPKGEGDPEIPGGLAAASPWKRLGVLVAGPVMNLLTAVIVMSVIIAQAGVGVPGKVLIDNVAEDSPAQQAGIQAKDVIVAINGKPVSTLDEARTLIRANLDTPIELTLNRGGEQVTLIATPLSSRTAEQGALGVGLAYPRRAATIGEIIGGGFIYTGAQALSILYIPIGLVQGAIAPDEARLVGLKGIYDFFGQAVQRDVQSRQEASQPSQGGQGAATTAETPTNYVLSLIAMLSISLGVFNLLPIPALDGGRILFTFPEIIFRRRIPPRLENLINGVAMMALIALMLFINAMDFINPVNINLP